MLCARAADLRSCVRRGAAIDVVLDRERENRSQIVFTTARGREACFWQSPRTRKQARPNVTTPTARAAGIPGLQIVVDSYERYAYRFATQQVTTVKRALPCGDYGLVVDGRLVAPGAPAPSTAQVRAWARAARLAVPDRGRLRPEIWDAWRAAHHG